MLKRYRKFVTSSVGLSFLVVGVTGVIFKLFFKTHILEEIHGWLGLAMFVAALIHIAQNWGPLRNYFRDLRVVALILPVVLACAVIALKPEEKNRLNPREVLHKLNHASAEDLSRVFRRNASEVLLAMKTDGLKVKDASQTLEDLAESNDRRPEELLGYFAN